MKIDIHKMKFKPNDKIYLSLVAIIIGVLTGLGAVGVHYLIEFVTYLFYGGTNLLELFENMPVWKILFFPSFAGLIVGFIINFWAREVKGSGVSKTLIAVLLRSGHIRIIVSPLKAIASSLSIGAGLSVGSEGPQAQIGSAISSVIGRFFFKKDDYVKILVAAGAGSGIAAAFNTPLAGAFFAAEVILGDFGVVTFSPIVIASVSATLVSKFFLGNRLIFNIPQYTINSHFEFFLYIILGTVAGFFSLLFIWSLYFTEGFFENRLKKVPEYLKPVIGAFTLGLIALVVPYVMGRGFDVINLMMKGKIAIWFIIILLFLKMFATNITLGSGHSGGVFAPSLFMGAALGIFFGYYVDVLFGLKIPIEVWAVLSMAAFVAGTTQAPITAMMMIFELTNYSLLLPLMTVSIIASLITMLIKKESIYTQNLIQKGVLLRSKEENDVIKSKIIKAFIIKEFHFFNANDNIEKMLMSFLGNKQHIFPVVNNSKERKLIGLISIDNLKYLIEEHIDAIGALIIAKDIMNPPEYLYIDDNLINALEIFADSDYSVLPVLNKENKLLGLVSEHKILKVYNDEYRKRKFAEAILKNSGTIDSVEGVALGNSLYIAEIEIPKELSKQKIKDIKFRNRFNLEIILVKTTKDKFFPESSYVLKETDKLMILGKAKDIHSFKLTYGIKNKK